MTLGGREFSIETGRMAKQAHGSVVVQYGDTMVLVTAVSDFEKPMNQDFFPLMVDYRERTYAAGKIPGGFFKREGRPSEKEILSSRLIDRPIRPLFAEGFFSDTQVIATVISGDQENPGDILGITGASIALSISKIPFLGPIAGVRVGRINGEYILNPTMSQMDESDIEIIVAGSEESIVMVEGETREISEDDLVGALEFGHKAIIELIQFQKEIINEIKPVKVEVQHSEISSKLLETVRTKTEPNLDEWRELALESKHARSEAIANFTKSLVEELEEDYQDQDNVILGEIDEILKKNMRRHIVETQVRQDGRGLKDIRPITCEVGVLPRAHGSALFTRGETQSLGSVTLGTKMDEQIIDDIDREEFKKRFMLHYNFPPFSVGEVRPMRGTGRREVGHGNLAERSFKTLLPDQIDFPYTVRIVSDILESNGSSSMASVCAGSLALMDAGVPIKKTVAGIAMGLIKEGDKVAVLSDILGAEDHYGDMDFKVTGTKDGITAIQMDLKVAGISTTIMREALEQAREGRYHIIDIMEQTINEARPDISKYAPKMTTVQIPVDMIGELIGPGGKNIKAIQADSGATVEINDDGLVFISAVNTESSDIAVKAIRAMMEQPEEGKTYTDCAVKRIETYGAFVEILPGKEGLLHVSEIAWERTNDVNDVFKVGDKVTVLLKKISQPGRFELSIKELLGKPEGYVEEVRHSRPPRSDGDRSRNPRYNDRSDRSRNRY
ncbi:polyribonucleotide nucleotidyltransferase [bacterium]|nr:polyribonucleotide nucleotidyltransferase [bacterium]MBU1063712.1 polyribonucleotide nucleotidyltransferase [bacterium]MBU1634394.1 polyribonucleotide nucleotidyltransferase [bacterium]MBU1874323.1 polyribonucleotide nucleotidyltransferase [bacterium]